MASQYVTATNDTAFLHERVGPAQARVADTLLALSLHWQSVDVDGDLLAEYSADAGNYLECVPHYRGAVAALQAGSVFMMRSVADMVDALFPGDAALGPWPAQLRGLASNMSAVTRARLYVPGAGQWAAFVGAASPQLAAVLCKEPGELQDDGRPGRIVRGLRAFPRILVSTDDDKVFGLIAL